MKIKTLFSGIFFLVSLNLLLFSGCELEWNTSNVQKKIPAPSVESIGSGILISIQDIPSYVSVINIYREDVALKDSKANIAILYSDYFNENRTMCLYEDTNLHIDHTYKYSLKFFNFDGKSNVSYISKEVKAKNGYTNEKLTYTVGDAYMRYDPNFYELSVVNSISFPELKRFEEDYSPVLLFTAENGESKFFEIKSLSENSVIDLRLTLSEDFLNREITLTGILAQKKITLENEKTRLRVLTAPVEIQVIGTRNNKMKIPAPAEDNGFYY